MAEQIFPTKGNLIKMKRSLKQAQLGYELMDRKRNILIREMVNLTDEAKRLRSTIDETYTAAYKALQLANISMGVVSEVSKTIPVDDSIEMSVRSVMGVELPRISAEQRAEGDFPYGMMRTNSSFDNAYICFNRAKDITVRLAEIENSIYRLAVSIKRTQKRANALKNIMIPKFRSAVRYISNALEEKEREEFSRQKVIKKAKLKKEQ
ncbi:MAG: V-type ATP synthase subunit D [Oscillospiraceae bacterium]|nr:V-type ATP synthase subunit D [Oscillospiraceae bacterium]